MTRGGAARRVATPDNFTGQEKVTMKPSEAPTATPDVALEHLLDVVTNIRDGHFTTHAAEGLPGTAGRVAHALNELLKVLQAFHREHRRLAEETGVTGRLGGTAEVPGARGAWAEMVDSTNRMAHNLTEQVRDVVSTAEAAGRGEAGRRVTCDKVRGEYRELRQAVNALVTRLERQAEAAAV